MGSSRQQLLLETLAARQRAVELLKSLEQAAADCEAQLKAEDRIDRIKVVTGRSSLEEAITSTQRMIDMLDRAMSESQQAGAAAAPAPTPTPLQDPAVDAQAYIQVVARIGPKAPAGPIGRTASR